MKHLPDGLCGQAGYILISFDLTFLRNMLSNGFIILYVFGFTSNTFISNPRLKLTKNQANAKQHPKAKFLLFKYYSHSTLTLSFKK